MDPVKRYDWRSNNSSSSSLTVPKSPTTSVKATTTKNSNNGGGRKKKRASAPNISPSISPTTRSPQPKRHSAPIGGRTGGPRRRSMIDPNRGIPAPPLSAHPLSQTNIRVEKGRKKKSFVETSSSSRPPHPPPPPQNFIERIVMNRKNKKQQENKKKDTDKNQKSKDSPLSNPSTRKSTRV